MSSETAANDDLGSFQDAQDNVESHDTAPESTETNTPNSESGTTTSQSKKKKIKKKKKKIQASDSQLDLSAQPEECVDRDDDSEMPLNPESNEAVLGDTKFMEGNEGIPFEPKVEHDTVESGDHSGLRQEGIVIEVDQVIKEKAGADVDVEQSIEETQKEADQTPEVPETSEDIETQPIEEPAEAEKQIEMKAEEDADNTADISEPPISQSTNTSEDVEALKRESHSLLENKLKQLEVENTEELEAEAEEEKLLQPPSSILPNRPVPPVLPDRNTAPARNVNAGAPPQLPAKNPPPEVPKRGENGLKRFKIRSTSQFSAADLPPPPLPPQLSAEQKAHHRPNTLQSWFHKPSNSTQTSDKTTSEKSVDLEENYDLLLSRLSENNEEYLAKDEESKEQINISANTLRTTFAEKVSSFEKEDDDTTAEISEIHKVDWPFWTQVVNDYASVAKSDPSKLSKQLASGIPTQIRGIVWQLVANSNPHEFEETYKDLQAKESKFEKGINKDLSRTTFISDYGLSVESLFKIIKSYSILDSEVGYTQGMAFITVPLLMNMGELETFTLLHKLMFGYNIRSLYLPEMPGLHIKLYQFDRILEDTLPNLHTHLLRQGIRSSMYASQWFLTFFAYKFPLEFVLRIFDFIITEGFESILRFAIALMQSNELKLLTLSFDDLLEYLKESLFNAYLTPNAASKSDAVDDDDESVQAGGVGGFFTKKKQQPVSVITVDSYDVNKLVEDAMNVKILPISLKRYEDEYQEIHRVEKERQEEVEELRLKNNQLRKEIRKIESSYTLLNREHVQIANEMINGRMKIATLEDEKKDLSEQNGHLRERVKSYQTQEILPVPTDLEEDLKLTMERNLEVMTKNEELEEQISQLIQELDELKAKNKDPSPQPTEFKAEHLHKQSSWTKKLFK